MPLNPQTLADGLEAIEPTVIAPAALQGFIDAWEAYFLEATPPPSSISAGLVAMLSAMAPTYSLPSSAPAAIQTGITAFWAALAASPTAVYSGALAITAPTTLGGLSGPLLQSGSGNVGNASTVGLSLVLDPDTIVEAGNLVSNGSTNFTLDQTIENDTSTQAIFTATGTATVDGQQEIGANQITTIVNPVTGWISVTNPAPVPPNAPKPTNEAVLNISNIINGFNQGGTVTFPGVPSVVTVIA